MKNNIDGKKLVELREQRFLSRQELAQRADLATSAVQRIEQSRATTVRGRTLRKLAGGLAMEEDEFEIAVRPGGRTVTLPADLTADLQLLAGKRSVVDYLREHVKLHGVREDEAGGSNKGGKPRASSNA